MHGDTGIITVTSHNRGDMDVTINISNMPILDGENKYRENIVIDPKRRRVDIGGIKNNIGPISMQMDGPGSSITKNIGQTQELNDPKT